ncbi:MAG: NAD-dependent malic enzyme [Anaerolineales bacterium]|jgi:malate dehydrogenase (oxaloacetate-decarboxylating)|uniref:NAD-dependent malic enzyme n=1 Tax=Candidatus Villigracilis vicinus TaxID=3140679 RepID=UPI003135BC02|nr:NAD-dependent malic enzyme [Anaerolineales bacterium]MBK9779578.1 NAD-dependent malic enzyme [Anaerolineales bacterium]
MAWDQKIFRIVRVRNSQKKGVLAKLLTAIAEAGGNIGSMVLVTETSLHVVRDLTITVESESMLETVLEAMRANEGTKIIEVRDEVLELHQKGKIAIRSRYPIESLTTLRRVYTPGVAEVCLRIAKDPSQARLYTSISHMVAIVTDGTAVLGLGDIGPLAGMPVMEGKAMLMETLVGLSGIPILLNTKDTDEIVNTVAAISPTFAAIQLEDISAPRCFEIEERLQAMLDIPVLHDDQHGTAVVCTAALMTATRETGMDLKKAVIGQIGLGAAGQAIGQMMMRLTGNPVHGADLSPEALSRFEKLGGIKSNLKDIMANCDIVVATTGAPNLIKPEMVRKGQIILALSNPNAEIDPEVAMEHGAAFAADGKSVNNVLGFPGIFRGAVDANAPRITQEMLVAAAETIASMTPPGELVPSPLNKKVHRAVARAVAEMAIKQGIARADYVPYVEE